MLTYGLESKFRMLLLTNEMVGLSCQKVNKISTYIYWMVSNKRLNGDLWA